MPAPFLRSVKEQTQSSPPDRAEKARDGAIRAPIRIGETRAVSAAETIVVGNAHFRRRRHRGVSVEQDMEVRRVEGRPRGRVPMRHRRHDTPRDSRATMPALPETSTAQTASSDLLDTTDGALPGCSMELDERVDIECQAKDCTQEGEGGQRYDEPPTGWDLLGWKRETRVMPFQVDCVRRQNRQQKAHDRVGR